MRAPSSVTDIKVLAFTRVSDLQTPRWAIDDGIVVDPPSKTPAGLWTDDGIVEDPPLCDQRQDDDSHSGRGRGRGLYANVDQSPLSRRGHVTPVDQ